MKSHLVEMFVLILLCLLISSVSGHQNDFNEQENINQGIPSQLWPQFAEKSHYNNWQRNAYLNPDFFVSSTPKHVSPESQHQLHLNNNVFRNNDAPDNNINKLLDCNRYNNVVDINYSEKTILSSNKATTPKPPTDPNVPTPTNLEYSRRFMGNDAPLINLQQEEMKEYNPKGNPIITDINTSERTLLSAASPLISVETQRRFLTNDIPDNLRQESPNDLNSQINRYESNKSRSNVLNSQYQITDFTSRRNNLGIVSNSKNYYASNAQNNEIPDNLMSVSLMSVGSHEMDKLNSDSTNDLHEPLDKIDKGNSYDHNTEKSSQSYSRDNIVKADRLKNLTANKAEIIGIPERNGRKSIKPGIEDQLIEPALGSGIVQISKAPFMSMKYSKVCYACSTASDVTCWSPNRKTTVKYCRPGHDVCVTKTYRSADSSLIVIRDCSSSCDVSVPVLDTRYKSCSVCNTDMCNDIYVESSANSLSVKSLMCVVVITSSWFLKIALYL